MVLRFHFWAVASVTVTVSVSAAGAGVRTERSPGNARCRASSTSFGSVMVFSGSK